MRVILDTCALSEYYHPQGKKSVKVFIDNLPNPLIRISTITLGEIAKGIEILPMGKKKQNLLSWFIEIRNSYTEHILVIDEDTALIWGKITGTLQKSGKQLAVPDGLIAATALQHNLHIVTRNIKDFEGTGVTLINPWEQNS